MTTYDYVIVGAGMTGDAAVRGIRDVDRNGSIGMLGSEADAPYIRPPLTKGLWKGKPLEKIWRNTAALSVDLHLGRRVVSMDPEAKCVVDDQGASYAYGKLLLATGGTPRRLPFGGEDILYYRTLQDYRRLAGLAEQGQGAFGVIGGGFIGTEIAAALSANGHAVVMVFPDEVIGQRIYPRDLAEYVTQYYRDRGVQVRAGMQARGLQSEGTGYVLRVVAGSTGREESIAADQFVAGLGIVPNVELARSAGAKVEDGIVVDAGLRTNLPDVYAAGDVASFYNPALGKRLRVEHEDNANTMGRMAGQAMAGKPMVYDHLPFFYSDLFDLGYEAVGETDARLETFSDWQEPYRKGVIYYLREGQVRGVLLWNVWGQVDAARLLIAGGQAYRSEDLRGKITG
jgi:3-phenylpropionate/trans-cinnamate dioxygenase ferredoxin reductase component